MRTHKKFILPFIVAAVIIATLVAVISSAGQQTNKTTTTVSSDTTTIVETTEAHVNEETEFIFLYSKKIPLPFVLQGVMQQACKDYDVPYALALAVAECESDFDLEADNGICWGVMQINSCNYPRLRELGIEPTEYEGNIISGVFMLSELLNKYGDTHKALMAYNCGESGALNLWNQGYETSAYSRKVITQSNYWQQMIQN